MKNRFEPLHISDPLSYATQPKKPLEHSTSGAMYDIPGQKSASREESVGTALLRAMRAEAREIDVRKYMIKSA